MGDRVGFTDGFGYVGSTVGVCDGSTVGKEVGNTLGSLEGA